MLLFLSQFCILSYFRVFVGHNNIVGKKVHFGAILGWNGLLAYGASWMDVFGVLKRVSTYAKIWIMKLKCGSVQIHTPKEQFERKRSERCHLLDCFTSCIHISSNYKHNCKLKWCIACVWKYLAAGACVKRCKVAKSWCLQDEMMQNMCVKVV